MTVYANPLFPEQRKKMVHNRQRGAFYVLRSTEDKGDFAVINLASVTGWNQVSYACFCGDGCSTPRYLVEQYLEQVGLPPEQPKKQDGEIARFVTSVRFCPENETEADRMARRRAVVARMESLVEFAKENGLLVNLFER